MKLILILAVIAVFAAPYCLNNKTTVGDIAKDVKNTTTTVVDTVRNKTTEYTK